MSRLEALAVGKACYQSLYSYSKLKKREPLIALGSYQFLRPQYPTTGNQPTNQKLEIVTGRINCVVYCVVCCVGVVSCRVV